MKIVICPICNKEFLQASRKLLQKYCSVTCYATTRKGISNTGVSIALKGKSKPRGFGKKVSEAMKGKPKPWNCGENNPNFQNKSQSKHREKFLKAVRKRGQPWKEEHKIAHSDRMKTDTNWMKGKKHSDATKTKVSESKLNQYKNGTVSIRRINISNAEKEIQVFLKEVGVKFESQYRIKNVSFIYDFYFPDKNLIIEYNGDFWHCNPDKYKSNEIIKRPHAKSEKVRDIWLRDALKRQLAEAANYRFIVVWESEFKKRGMNIFKEILGL